jgi:hypothetical protein
MSILSCMNKSCTISRMVSQQSAIGTTKKIYTPLAQYTDIAVNIQPLTGRKLEVALKLQQDVDYVLYFPADLQLQNGDKATDNNGVSYLIQYPRDQAGVGRLYAVYGKLLID